MITDTDTSEKQWRSIYIVGGLMTIVALVGILLDVIISNARGGKLPASPKTAIDRFRQFDDNS